MSKRSSYDPRFTSGRQVSQYSYKPSDYAHNLFGVPAQTPPQTEPVNIYGQGTPPMGVNMTWEEFEKDPIKALMGYSAFTGQGVQQKLLPQYLDMMNKKIALPQMANYQQMQPDEIPDMVSLINTLREIAPNLDPLASTYQPNKYTESDYTAANYYKGPEEYQPAFKRTQAITANVLNDPGFKAFQRELEEATGKQSRSITDEMAKRGILSSGATKEQFENLNEVNSRTIASKMGEIASPLLQESAIQQNIREPIRETEFGERGDLFRFGAGEREVARRTGFGEREAARQTGFDVSEAGRQTAFDLVQQKMKEDALRNAINRAIGVSSGEQSIRGKHENLFSELLRREREKYQTYTDRKAMLPYEQDVASMGYMSNIQNLINSVLTGSQTNNSGLGALISQQKIAQQSDQFNRQLQQKEDIQQQNLWMQSIPIITSTIASLLSD